MLKPTILLFGALSLAGCALFEPRETAVVAAAPERAAPPLQKVSLGASPRLKSSQPVGLAPCKQGVFSADACWRKGDSHYVYEDPAPEGLESSSLNAPSPTLVRN